MSRAGLVGGALAAMFAPAALAASLSVTWTLPTQYTDGRPLPVGDLAGTRVEFGKCAAGGGWGSKEGEVFAAAPAVSVSIPVTGWGAYCVRAYARTTDAAGARESVASNVSSKVIPAPEPKPPVLVTVEAVAYELRTHPVDGVRLGRAVGAVPLGVECAGPAVFEGFYPVPLEAVALRHAPRSAVVVARCEVAS